jgi:hypothetical protein
MAMVLNQRATGDVAERRAGARHRRYCASRQLAVTGSLGAVLADQDGGNYENGVGDTIQDSYRDECAWHPPTPG